MNPRIDQRIAPMVLAPQTLLMLVTKEVIADAASGGVWVNRTPRRVSRTGVNGSTPGKICNDVSIVEPPSPFLIIIVATSPHFFLNGSLHVFNKPQSTSPGLGRNNQNFDNVVDRKLPDDLNSASIFSQVIGFKLSDGSSSDLYLRCRMNFAGGVLQTQTPQFMDLGFSATNALGESIFLSTPDTRI